MAMDENLMADAVLAELGGDTASPQGLRRKAAFAKLCKGIIAHLKAAAEIDGVVAPGLTTAPGGGPVTGTLIAPPGSIK